MNTCLFFKPNYQKYKDYSIKKNKLQTYDQLSFLRDVAIFTVACVFPASPCHRILRVHCGVSFLIAT